MFSRWCGSLERGTQVSSSSSDRGTKLRGPSQNNPHVASKRNINKTKLNSRQIKLILVPQLSWETSLFPLLHGGKSDVSQPNQGYQNRPRNAERSS
ncbi:hypothetical protein AVEN_82152-1 [Araneus ventricosus]|uniref:Uncharacterized protein n=1 Tax=Araneus ventricosus TaxID=182803 RepID=A0A4Y2G275_ARAVE|nr:hypothetical protein AVEN_82152-1 [Araneus ventricosus]